MASARTIASRCRWTDSLLPSNPRLPRTTANEGGSRGAALVVFLSPEHHPVVPVPRALEQLLRIVLALEGKKLTDLRIASLDLILARPAVIRQVIAAAVP